MSIINNTKVTERDERVLIFVTGNNRKIKEATDTLSPMGIDFTTQSIDMHEIQSSNSEEIAKAKARSAYETLKSPVVVSDTSWEIPALGGFPGGYMKDVASWWTAEDWLAVMSRHDDKRIVCMEHVAYCDGETLKHFSYHYEGYFLSESIGATRDGGSFENLVVLYGDQTMSEQLSMGLVASAGETLHHWHSFGDWYVGYNA